MRSKGDPEVRWTEAYITERISNVNVGGELSGAIPIRKAPVRLRDRPTFGSPIPERLPRCPTRTDGMVPKW